MPKFKDVLLVAVLALMGAFSFGLLTGYQCGVMTTRKKPVVLVLPVNDSSEIKKDKNNPDDNSMRILEENKSYNHLKI